jgi:hypothetical protein
MIRHVSLLMLLTAAACSPDYPMDKAGTWRIPEVSSNDANLRTLVANPRDLTAGVGDRRTLAAEAGPPVRRLLTGRRYPLPASNVLQVEMVGQPQVPAQEGPNVGQ